MINSSVLLVNLPYKITQVLIPLIKEELLGHFTLINDVNLSEFLPAQLNPNCIIVAYDESIKEEELASLNICEGIPVALITQNINFEMERTAKANKVSTIIDEKNDELITLVYSFIKQYHIYQSQFALIVDDSRVDSYTISNILTHEFIKNTIELCPEKVIDLLKKTPAINIIILDYEMPNMNGCELMQAIKSEFVHRDFIFISSTGNRNGSIKLLNMGVDEIFTKPMDVEIFTISLRKLIFNKHQVKINKNALADYKSILKSITKGIYDPMYVLLTINDCLIDDMLDKNKLEEIKNICESSKDKLKHTFDDLLSYLEVTSYVESPALKPCSLQSMIAAQLFLESSLAKMRNIIIKKTFDVDLKNLHVPQQIEQVVNHLTHNAILQSKKNSEINVRLFIQDLEIVFEVEDSRESSLERQYETSYSDKASIAEIEQLYHDQPLNFSLCRKVIDSHGGLMGIKRGKIGNVVYFKLPVSSSLNQNLH